MLEQSHLQSVGILELIDGDAAVAKLEMPADVGVLAQDFFGEQQQVIEIHGVLSTQFVLIGDGERRKIVVWYVCGIVSFVFGFGNGGQHGVGFDFLIAAALAN